MPTTLILTALPSVILQWDDQDADGGVYSPEITHRYLQGPLVDQILADEQPEAGETYWPLQDHMGTVRDVAHRDATTGDLTTANSISYDAFGNITAIANRKTIPAMGEFFAGFGFSTKL